MIYQNIDAASQCSPIILGRCGENQTTCICFDCSKIFGAFGSGRAQLLHRNASGTVYPISVIQNGMQLMWTITASDTQYAGMGSCEIRWYVNDLLAKSAILHTQVLTALAVDTISEPPQPQKGWMDTALRAASDAAAVRELASSGALSPKRGIDYWTEEDCAQMRASLAADVSAAKQELIAANNPGHYHDVCEGYLSDGIFYTDDTFTYPFAAERGRLYIDLSTNMICRWSGSEWVLMTPAGFRELTASDVQALWNA